MSRLKSFTTLSNLKTVEDLSRYYAIVMDQVEQILNGGISFSENVQSSSAEVTFTASGTEVIVTHGLKTTPLGYLVIKRSAAITVYDGLTTWTQEYISLRADGAGTATVLVIA